MVSLCGLRGEAGHLVRGRWPLALTLPGGGEPEALPLVIATGAGGEGGGGAAGPKLLLTANIHGPEHNGLIVAHRVIEWLETAAADGSLLGTVVVFPCLNVSGHRAMTRWPDFDEGVDPNRQWPDARPPAARDPKTIAGFSNGYSSDASVPTPVEPDYPGDTLAQYYTPPAQSGDGAIAPAWAALQREWGAVGFDAHIDLHTMGGCLSTPVVYIDRILYDSAGGAAAKAEAARLHERQKALCVATGLSILISGSVAVSRHDQRWHLGCILPKSASNDREDRSSAAALRASSARRPARCCR
eukprot:COSAG04_NODE_1387_length_6965_cov_11.221381_8_plen_300_part_00